MGETTVPTRLYHNEMMHIAAACTQLTTPGRSILTGQLPFLGHIVQQSNHTRPKITVHCFRPLDLETFVSLWPPTPRETRSNVLYYYSS